MELRGIQWFDGRWNHEFSSTNGRTSLNDLRTAIPGDNYIFIDCLVDCSGTANTATPRTTSAPTQSELTAAINYAHSKGLKVVVRTRTNVTAHTFKPTDPTAFLINFTQAVVFWASFAKSLNVEVFGIGTELEWLEYNAYSTLWKAMIAQVRAVYTTGKVYYNTNHWHSKVEIANETIGLNNKLAAAWMKDLDFIAISAYPVLVMSADHPAYPAVPTVDQLLQGWHAYVAGTDMHGEDIVEGHFGALSRAHGKPIILHSGLASLHGNCSTPWAYSACGCSQCCSITGYTTQSACEAAGGTWLNTRSKCEAAGKTWLLSIEEQVVWYEALFEAFKDKTWIHGFLFDGSWLTTPLATKDPNNIEFSIQNKPAQQIVAYYYTALTPPTPSDYSWLILLGLAAAIIAGG